MRCGKLTTRNETEKPTITLGIRLGTAAITTRGVKEYEMVKIGNYIADILSASKDELEKLSYIKEEIKALNIKIYIDKLPFFVYNINVRRR